MDFLGLFGRDNAEAAYNGAYAELARKIDLLLSGLNVETFSLTDEGGLPEDVRDLIAQGRKIEAIKRYRERTGLGLAEAKDAVEGEGANALSPILLLEKKLNLILKTLKIEDPGAPESTLETVVGTDAEVQRLIRQGNLIGAIKAYREQHGVGLKEAKDAVDAMAGRFRGR